LQLLSVSRNGSRALQIGQKKVVIENKIKLSSAHLETKSTIKGLQITECFLHSWNGTAIDVYNIGIPSINKNLKFLTMFRQLLVQKTLFPVVDSIYLLQKQMF
jgi:hypothetical protein